MYNWIFYTLFFNQKRFIVIFVLMIILLCSCTVSFQNIDTHGTSSDLIDEAQDAKADVDAKFTFS